MPPQPQASAGTGVPAEGRLLEGRYLLGPRIARGGMASVHEATDLRLDRTVAVKIMHAGLGDDDGAFVDRFVREARAAARLSHPNVVAVHDQGEDDGTVFLVMELVSGHTLRDVVTKQSPLPPSRALALVEPVLSALAAAHRAGLIHRDVKPENVLIADDGRVKVADFGLARAVSADTRHTATGGVLIGTVSYLAPELVVDGRADARADVYAAGVMLFELLTGTKPHEGESPIQVAYKHVHEDVPPPSRLVPGIPEYVDALVARATARDRSLRPADASVFLHQLHRVAQALAHGVREDAELTADLTPRAVHPDTDELDLPPDLEILPVPHDAAPSADDGGAQQLVAAAASPAVVETGTAAAPPAPPARAADAAARPPSGPRRSRRGLLVLLLALLLAAGVGTGAWWFGFARYTTTPGVIGLTQVAAEKKLDGAGLDTELGDPAYSNTVPEGEVIRTEPGAGDRVLDGGTVLLTLSLGVEMYDVPKVRGGTEDEAQDALGESNLEFGTSTERWSETVPAGVVLSSKPKAGTSVRPGTAVDLVVSKGRRPIQVGDWVGEDADEAEERLTGRGLTVTRAEERYSDDFARGEVISHTPSGGTVFKGDEVALVVSLGPELVEMPRVIAFGVDAATAKLEALGFTVRVSNSTDYLGLGFVFRTDPSAGDMVPKGSTITLYLI